MDEQRSIVFRVQQPMHVDDEIAHMRIVHRQLRLRLPCRKRRRIIRIDSDNIEIVQVAELDVRERRQFAAENEVKALFRVNGFSHGLSHLL